jgi:putative tricarboxylic transport membrane protein
LPYYVIYPGILLISIVGVYSVHNSLFDVWVLLVFGVMGYVMRKLDIPAAPLVLAFVLGPMAERALRQSLVMSQNSLEIFFTRPVSLVLLIIAVLLLIAPLFNKARQLRQQVLEEEV